MADIAEMLSPPAKVFPGCTLTVKVVPDKREAIVAALSPAPLSANSILIPFPKSIC